MLELYHHTTLRLFKPSGASKHLFSKPHSRKNSDRDIHHTITHGAACNATFKQFNQFLFQRRADGGLEGPPNKQNCSESRAIMTTQAVTPASAAAGLGLLMHPGMMMMHHHVSPQVKLVSS